MHRASLALAVAALLVAAGSLIAARPGRAQGFPGDRKLRWERLEVDVQLRDRPGMATSEREALQERLACYRTKVPGGWLVMSPRLGGITFYPDPQYAWTGGSLE